MEKTLKILISLTVLISATIGVNAYFAKASRLELVEMRLEHKILADRAHAIQAEIWKIEDRYTKPDGSVKIPVGPERERYRKLKEELKNLQAQMGRLFKGK